MPSSRQRSQTAYPAARALLVDSIAKGYYPLQFDIRNAFIQSELAHGEHINCLLPKEWGDGPELKVRLIRALYGLRVSPATWCAAHRKGLLELGWEENPSEPGTFRKLTVNAANPRSRQHMKLIIYVDDCLVLAPTGADGHAEVSKILAKFSGQLVPPVRAAGGEIELDFLGMQVIWNQSLRTLRIVASKAIARMRKKFNFPNPSKRLISGPAEKNLDINPTEEDIEN